MEKYAETQIASNCLSSITDLNSLAKIITGITSESLVCINDAVKADTFVIKFYSSTKTLQILRLFFVKR